MHRMTALTLCIVSAIGSPFAAVGQPITVELQGVMVESDVQHPHVVFNPRASGCEPGYDVPDAPARAFRDYRGLVHLIATNHHNRGLVGRSLTTVTHTCSVIFRGAEDRNPEKFDDYGWLASFYTKDGRTIAALVHNEYHAFDVAGKCKTGRKDCIEYSITAAESADGGDSFHRSLAGPIVRAPMPYALADKVAIGASNPTNIVELNGFFYAGFASLGVTAGYSGECLMRSSDPLTPSSWETWNGTRFSRSGDPCQPVGGQNLFYATGSISFNERRKLFVAVMRRQIWDKLKVPNEPGIYISTSSDLFSWTTPVLLLADKSTGSPQVQMLFPSLIDPKSSDRNFSTVSGQILLYTVDVPHGGKFDDHQLVYRRLNIDALLDSIEKSTLR